MEMMNVMYELATTKTALELAEKTIRKQKGKLLHGWALLPAGCWARATRSLRKWRQKHATRKQSLL